MRGSRKMCINCTWALTQPLLFYNPPSYSSSMFLFYNTQHLICLYPPPHIPNVKSGCPTSLGLHHYTYRILYFHDYVKWMNCQIKYSHKIIKSTVSVSSWILKFKYFESTYLSVQEHLTCSPYLSFQGYRTRLPSPLPSVRGYLTRLPSPSPSHLFKGILPVSPSSYRLFKGIKPVSCLPPPPPACLF